MAAKEGLPDPLNGLMAPNFLYADDRSRGPDCLLPQFRKVASPQGLGISSNEKSLALLKAALLLIESALPIGSVDRHVNGAWNAGFASSWRKYVEETESPSTLMGCVVLLEDSLSDKWMKPHAFHLLSCLPRHWKAVSDASLSSLYLRLWLLDSSISYDFVNKSRKGSSKKRRITR